jgi:hypothetical protein
MVIEIEFTEQTEDRLTNGNRDSEEENSIISSIYFSFGMNLSVEITFATFSSIKVHTLIVIFTLLV